MTLEECSKLYDISIYYNEGKWYWNISNPEVSTGSAEGWYNPNTTKLELIEYLRNLNE